MNFRPNLNMAAIGLLLSMAFFQNACTLAPTDYDAVSHDYRARHNLEVKAGVARLSVGFEKERSSMSVAMVGDLKIFFAEYIRLGRGAIQIVVYDDGSAVSVLQDRIDAIKALARDSGVFNNEMTQKFGRLNHSEVAPVELTFRAYAVEVPACGDWTRDNINSFDNSQMKDFGCSTNANLGRMVADPGDLLSRKRAAAPDSSSVVRVIGQHQAGETPSSVDNKAGPESIFGSTE